jgi:hypothetical protein
MDMERTVGTDVASVVQYKAAFKAPFNLVVSSSNTDGRRDGAHQNQTPSTSFAQHGVRLSLRVQLFTRTRTLSNECRPRLRPRFTSSALFHPSSINGENPDGQTRGKGKFLESGQV